MDKDNVKIAVPTVCLVRVLQSARNVLLEHNLGMSEETLSARISVETVTESQIAAIQVDSQIHAVSTVSNKPTVSVANHLEQQQIDAQGLQEEEESQLEAQLPHGLPLHRRRLRRHRRRHLFHGHPVQPRVHQQKWVPTESEVQQECQQASSLTKTREMQTSEH